MMTDTEENMTPATSEESVVAPDPSGRHKKHPAYNMMVKRAISNLKSQRGSSKKAIVKYILNKYVVKKTHCVRASARALQRMVKGGLLAKTAGGRFKLTPRGRAGRGRRRRKGRKRTGRRKRRKGRKGKRRRKRKARKGRRKRRTRRRKSRRRGRRARRRRGRKAGRKGTKRRRR